VHCRSWTTWTTELWCNKQRLPSSKCETRLAFLVNSLLARGSWASSTKPSDISPAIITAPPPRIAARYSQPSLRELKRVDTLLFNFALHQRTGFQSEGHILISFSLGAYSAPLRGKPVFPSASGSSFPVPKLGDAHLPIAAIPLYKSRQINLAAASRHPILLLVIRTKSCVAPERVTWGLSDSRQAEFGDLECSTCAPDRLRAAPDPITHLTWLVEVAPTQSPFVASRSVTY
jgi:hypothetical protein